MQLVFALPSDEPSTVAVNLDADGYPAAFSLDVRPTAACAGAAAFIKMAESYLLRGDDAAGLDALVAGWKSRDGIWADRTGTPPRATPGKSLWKALFDSELSGGRKLLHLAAAAGKPAIAAYCLDSAVPVDAPDAKGMTPLMIAARAGNAALVKLFLAAKADPKLEDAAGMSVLDHARAGSSKEAVAAIGAALRP